MDKEEFNEINDSLKRIILMGRSGERSFINGTILRLELVWRIYQ